MSDASLSKFDGLITGVNNPADAMTKSAPNRSLQMLIDTNEVNIEVEGWVDRKLTTVVT
jgi:hypothetical protein